MAHDTHFLERLERMSRANVELALGLYRDRPLLRFILASVKLPDGAERVAISLDDPQMGPFIVVMRDGTFVTCLGDGMPVRDLPVVTRGQLEGLSAKVEKLREDVGQALAALRPNDGPDAVLTPIIKDGYRACREDMEAAVALRPLNHNIIVQLWCRFGDTSAELRESLTPRIRQMQRRRTEQIDSVLRSYLTVLYAHANIAMLMENGPLLIEEHRKAAGMEPLGTFSWSHTRCGLLGPALRGLWAMGPPGKAGLTVAKQRYSQVVTRLQYYDTCFGLAVLGLRNRPLTAEVRKTLRKPPTAEGPDQEVVQSIGAVVSSTLQRVFDDPEAAVALQDARFRRLAVVLSERNGHEPPWTYETEADVPDELVRALPATLPLPFLDKPERLLMVLLGLPRIARARPEELFLPRELVRLIPPLDPQMALDALESVRDAYGQHAQVKRAPRPGRNDKCPCGSGKKYKRCCIEGDDGE